MRVLIGRGCDQKKQKAGHETGALGLTGIMSERLHRPEAPSNRSIAAYVGYTMAVIVVVYSMINVVRATVAGPSFAAAMGLPTTSDNAFVDVYAIRTAFIALFGLSLILTRQDRTLARFVALAVLMPLADAVLVWASGASMAYVAKHAIIAVYLVVTAALLARSPSPRMVQS